MEIDVIANAVNSALRGVSQDVQDAWLQEYPGESVTTLAVLRVCFRSLFEGDAVCPDVSRWTGGVSELEKVTFDSNSNAYEECLNSVDKDRRNSTGTWYTPLEVSNAMVGYAVEALGRSPNSFLDMASGQGVFADSVVSLGLPSKFVSWELQAVPVLLAKEKYARNGGNVDVVRKDALSEMPSDRVDIVIGNPPYKFGVNEHPAVDKFLPKSYGNVYRKFFSLAMHMSLPHGVVCLIHPNSVIHSNIGKNWREHLRNMADSIWIINVSPEGDLAPRSSRIFYSVRSPLCITIASNRTRPGVWYREVSGTHLEKIHKLQDISLLDNNWEKIDDDCDSFAPNDSLSKFSVDDILVTSRKKTIANFFDVHSYLTRQEAEDELVRSGGTEDSVHDLFASSGDVRFFVDKKDKHEDDEYTIFVPNNVLPKSGSLVSITKGATENHYGGSGSLQKLSLRARPEWVRAIEHLYPEATNVSTTLPLYILGCLSSSKFSELLLKPTNKKIPVLFPHDYKLYQNMSIVGEKVLESYTKFLLEPRNNKGCKSVVVKEPSVGVVTKVNFCDDGIITVGDGEFFVPRDVHFYRVNSRKLLERYLITRSHYNGTNLFLALKRNKYYSNIVWSASTSEGFLRCAWLAERLGALDVESSKLLLSIMDDVAKVEPMLQQHPSLFF